MDSRAMGDESGEQPGAGAQTPASDFENPWPEAADEASDRALFEQRDQKISVVVPARNEEEGIGAVLQFIEDAHSVVGTYQS